MTSPTRTAEAYFIYYRSFYGKPQPQIIFDIEMFEYCCETNKIPVVAKHGISMYEASLGIDKLTKLYPCETHNDNDRQQV